MPSEAATHAAAAAPAAPVTTGEEPGGTPALAEATADAATAPAASEHQSAQAPLDPPSRYGSKHTSRNEALRLGLAGLEGNMSSPSLWPAPGLCLQRWLGLDDEIANVSSAHAALSHPTACAAHTMPSLSATAACGGKQLPVSHA